MVKQFTLPALLILFVLLASAQKYPNLAPTPPMGWNSWNYFDCRVTEANIRPLS